jgi:hypothetical protein
MSSVDVVGMPPYGVLSYGPREWVAYCLLCTYESKMYMTRPKATAADKQHRCGNAHRRNNCERP